MPDWSQLGSLFDFSAVYYTTQLVRCAIFSYMLLGLVMLLRKVLFSGRTFLKGMLWTSFQLIPFLGKLKMFYENEFVINLTWRLTGAALLMIASAFLAVRTHSYARCNESRDIMIGNYDGKAEIISHDTGELSRMISYDDRFVYVRREAFEEFLEKNHGEGEIWIVFGGFYKLPGLAGAAEACIYERGLRDKIVRIPYESIMDNWYFELLKLL